jgi:hypothetical protein
MRQQPFPVTSNPFTPGAPSPIRGYSRQYGQGYAQGGQGVIGGSVPYGATADFFVARPDRRNLGLGTGGYGGQAGGFAGFGSNVAKTNAYRNRESPIIPETLADQGTYNQLPIWHDMKGMYGTSSFGPEINSCRCSGSSCACRGPNGTVSDSDTDRPGDYDIGIPAYGDINQAD